MLIQCFITRGDLFPAVACMLIFFTTACAFAARHPLIIGHEPVPPEIEAKIDAGEGMFGAAKRVSKVALLDKISAEGQLSVNDALDLNLFDDARYKASIDRISKSTPGTVGIRGRLESYPAGYVVISSTAGRSLVNIRIPEKNLAYTILFDPGTQAHYLLEIDPAEKDIKPGGPALTPPDQDSPDNF